MSSSGFLAYVGAPIFTMGSVARLQRKRAHQSLGGQL
jgi:hypothetical protein